MRHGVRQIRPDNRLTWSALYVYISTTSLYTCFQDFHTWLCKSWNTVHWRTCAVLGRNERDICGISVDTRVFPSGLVVFSKRYSNTRQNELGIWLSYICIDSPSTWISHRRSKTYDVLAKHWNAERMHSYHSPGMNQYSVYVLPVVTLSSHRKLSCAGEEDTSHLTPKRWFKWTLVD